jgi:hypothetical protein
MLSGSGNRRAGRVRETADRLPSPTKEAKWPLSSIIAAKRGGRKKNRRCRKNFAENLAENKTKGLP